MTMRTEPHRGRQHALPARQRLNNIRRQTQYADFQSIACVQGCERSKRCTQHMCLCSVVDNDALTKCVFDTCGFDIWSPYRDSIIAVCPRAFDITRRPEEPAGPVVLSRTTTTRVQTTRAPPKSTTTSRAPAPPPPAPPTSTPTPARPPVTRPSSTTSSVVVDTTRAQEVSSSSPVLVQASEPAEVLDEISSSFVIPTESSTADAQTSGLSFDSSNTSTLVSSDIDASRASPESDSNSADTFSSSAVEGEETLSSVAVNTDSGPSSQGTPALGPLDPSSPGQVSKLSPGVIAGIAICILAVIALFFVFWYRSYRRRERMVRGSFQISSAANSHASLDDDSASLQRWTEFGGAKGSIIKSHEELGIEKDAPIYSKFSSRSAVPSSALMASMHGRDSVSTAGIVPSWDKAFNNVRRSTGMGILSSLRSKGADTSALSYPPLYPTQSTNGPAVMPPVYKRTAGTSFFARLLASPIERTVAFPPAHSGPILPHPHFSSNQPAGSQSALASMPGQESNREGTDTANLDDHIRDQSRSGMIVGNVDDMRFSMPSLATPKTSAAPSPRTGGNGRTSFGFAWSSSARRLPPGMAGSEYGFEDGSTQHAASTRAPSLDLAWVTQGKNHTSERRPSTRGKNGSSKSASHRSLHRQSVMSAWSNSTLPSRAGHSSTGTMGEVYSPSSIPSFRLEIGVDRARSIMQRMGTAPVTPNVDVDQHDNVQSTDLCRDESRPVSVGHDEAYTPNLRDST